jgi:hypothetical protein
MNTPRLSRVGARAVRGHCPLRHCRAALARARLPPRAPVRRDPTRSSRFVQRGGAPAVRSVCHAKTGEHLRVVPGGFHADRSPSRTSATRSASCARARPSRSSPSPPWGSALAPMSCCSRCCRPSCCGRCRSRAGTAGDVRGRRTASRARPPVPRWPTSATWRLRRAARARRCPPARHVQLRAGGDAERVRGSRVTASLLSTLGLNGGRPGARARGRESRGAPVALISDAFWHRRFGGRPTQSDARWSSTAWRTPSSGCCLPASTSPWGSRICGFPWRGRARTEPGGSRSHRHRPAAARRLDRAGTGGAGDDRGTARDGASRHEPRVDHPPAAVQELFRRTRAAC